MKSDPKPKISVVVVSYNTRDTLRDCLASLTAETEGLSCEIIVVDNASTDGSQDTVLGAFPEVRLIASPVNLGFAAANNRAFAVAKGRYIVLVNSDAFLQSGALHRAVAHMDANPDVGVGGARLVGRDGSWQPSARLFPSLLNEFLSLSGLASRRANSKFFGRFDRTWADPLEPAEVDWVPGAFVIMRREVLDLVGAFDERMFLYYEEVDLCRRVKRAGSRVCYFPDVVVVHLGGESSRTVERLAFSSAGSQLTLWRMRSQLLYYRKHLGPLRAWLVRQLEYRWHSFRAQKNRWFGGDAGAAKVEESTVIAQLSRLAWQETAGGRVSPPRPW